MSITREDAYILEWTKKIILVKSLGGRCNRCGNDDIFVLEFHHVDSTTKDINIRSMREHRLSILKEEAKKCILLCRNCHAEEHNKNGRMAKKMGRFLFDRNILKCSKCGYTKENIGGLDFHHEDPEQKEFDISEVVSHAVHVNAQQLEQELLKCIVLCKNCHRREHTDMDRFNRLRTKIDNKVLTYKETRPYIDNVIVKDMFVRQCSIKEIANYLSYSLSSVCRALNRMGLREKKKKLNRINVEKVCESCGSSFFTKVKERRFCCKKCSCKKHSLPTDNELLDAANKFSYRELSKIYRVGKTSIFRWIKNARSRKQVKEK